MSDMYLDLFWRMQSESCTADIVELIVDPMLVWCEKNRMTEAQSIELIRLVSQISQKVMERCGDMAKDVCRDVFRSRER